MNLDKLIVPNRDFQTSVNIDYDSGDRSKVKSLIPIEAVCHYLEEILSAVVAPSSQRAKLFVGAYGKGKSHVVLAALEAMWDKDPSLFRRIIEAFRKRGLGFGETLEHFVTDGARLLPVVINGSTSDLRHSLLSALRNSLRANGYIMPQTNYDGAIAMIKRWKADFPETLCRLEEFSGLTFESMISQLKNMDTETYETFVSLYPQLTSGSSFDALEGANVIDVYEKVIDKLSGAGISGVYVVYDEFSKYLETSLDKATVEDTRLLQDFAEACNRSAIDKQMNLLLISHKSLSNYIDSKLPKEKVDGWRGVSGRFEEIAMHDDASQYYELMAAAITKDPDAWSHWLSDDGGANERRLNTLDSRYLANGLLTEDEAHLVAFGCYPLHPITAYLLPRLSERVAQNERTLFTFICSAGDHTLSSVIGDIKMFVTPDYVYDYFEPLLRKELYTSPLHKVYELARASLVHVGPDSLESRVIKTVAAIDVVAQFDAVAPTRQNIIDIFSDSGFSVDEVTDAIDTLVAEDSIVYLRRSNSYLQLKETTGVPIDREVADRSESLRNSFSCAEILNHDLGRRALYPSRYNEDYSIVRYFDCGFVDAQAFLSWQLGDGPILKKDGDGQIVAVFCATADEVHDLKTVAKASLSCAPMTVVAYPRTFKKVDDAIYRLEAARQLKDEVKEDAALVEEYEVVIEDYAEIVNAYIAGFFQPELMQVLYFVDGGQRKVITRKRKLSDELSDLCERTYSDTPRITNEALNKNELTGTAFSSRTKILKALCAPTLAPNLGFVGNGQETSMVRSALEKTGLISSISESINEPGTPNASISKVMRIIRNFLESAQDTPFEELYQSLTGPENGLGLRRGPIPIYLALALRDYRNEIKITHDGEERALSETVLDDLSKRPSSYRATRLNWSPQMEVYTKSLAATFGCARSDANRSGVVEAIRLWYAALPQVTRTCQYDHAHSGEASRIPTERAAFFRVIRHIDTDADVLLFDELPHIFGAPVGSDGLIAAISEEKRDCDDYLSDCIKALTSTIMGIFGPDAHKGTSLGSILKDWIEEHPAVRTRSFTGVNRKILSAVTAASGDDLVTASRIAKAVTSLRVDDWNDARFEDFPKILSNMKRQVEGVPEQSEDTDGDQLGIAFVGPDGTRQQKTFAPVKTSGRSRLLKNGLIACLSEMGASLSPEEKRQVVFDVLRGLC